MYNKTIIRHNDYKNRKKITVSILTYNIERSILLMGDNMLVRFSVSNYKNFKEPISIDFTATHEYRFNPKCVRNGLLSKIIIYGKNASGKSNFGFALFDIVALLTDKNTEPLQEDPNCFLNADSILNVARFEYVFRKGTQDITYIYEKSTPKTICYEELLIDGMKIFSYDFNTNTRQFDKLELINADTLNFEYYERNLPILRYIANNTSQPEDSIVRFIMNYVSHMLWFRSLQNNGYIGYMTGTENLNNWIINNNLVRDFQQFLKNIAGIDMELGAVSVGGHTPSEILIEKHGRVPLIFDNVASSGTRSLELLFYWSRKLKDVSFLFMDEFDAFYHFDLARNIVKYIVELDNVQAVFTTHNSYLAGNDLLRPDCYFVLENRQLKSFADSTNRELREGHNLEKLLRNGEFNA